MERGGRSRPEKINQDPEFFETFLPDRISHHLRIPPDFIKHFGQKIPDVVILKDLSERVWHVDIKQEEAECGIFFRNGWNRFVNDNSLELGEFLVFRYNKTSPSPLFIVRIFGLDACKDHEDNRKSFDHCLNNDEQESLADSTPLHKVSKKPRKSIQNSV